MERTSEHTLSLEGSRPAPKDGESQEANASAWIADEYVSWPSAETRDAVARRRSDLYEVMRDLERTVARPSGIADWRIEIERALRALKKALATHVHEVESGSGLFTQVMEQSPQLAANVETLRREHRDLMMSCENALSLTADLSDKSLRRRVNQLLVRLAIHRQTGAELLYDAYNVDVAAAD
ncbi:MAG TPA: hypothetical protein VFS66_03600 [Acidimicrobiia bacterium]|nr:hypothetical protein [Acidimicrobiia bacterium]